MIGFAVLQAAGSGAYGKMSELLKTSFEQLPRRDVTMADISVFGSDSLMTILGLIIPMGIILAAVAIVAGFAQIGPLFALKAFSPDFSRINVFTGLKRLFSIQSVFQTVKSIAKMSIVGAVAYSVLNENLVRFASLIGADPESSVSRFGSLAFELGIKCGGAFLVVAAFDAGYQRWNFNRQQKMTKQETKEEHKSMEGNPEIKARIRKVQREMAQGRMMTKIPTATVVITNPTHYAVDLAYYALGGGAPIVVAKGVDLIAQQIKKIAAENEVPTVENVPLARALYAQVELDQEIPADLYEAVAEVLAFIFRLRSGGRAA